MALDSDWLPECLYHLKEPHLQEGAPYVVIGQLSGEPLRGFKGRSLQHSILVPDVRLEEVLSNPGGIGWEVESWGPRPQVEIKKYRSDFWVEGPGGGEDHLEPIVVSWQYHNNTVMMPDNGLLMCYGLCPRILQKTDTIVWDDLSRPQYGIVTVKPLSHYGQNKHSGSLVEIDRDYLEDYASLKGCAIVSTFFEERWCPIDEELGEILYKDDTVSFEKPGYRLIVRRNRYSGEKVGLCQIWGCRLILKPTGRPISEEHDPILEWPGYSGPMDYGQAMKAGVLDYVYVSDAILEAYEGKSEFEINPLSGSIAYDGWWALDWCRRIGRNYIELELKKVYESCPSSLRLHLNKFSTSKAVAEADQHRFGKENIGTRADGLVKAYLDFGDALILLTDIFSLPFESAELIGLDRKDVEYYGWWRLSKLAPLGYRAPLDMTKDRFLERCKTIQQLFEGLKEKALRKLVEMIGVPKNNVKSLKLLATTLQLCQVASDAGLHIFHDRSEVACRWDKDIKLKSVTPFFALVDLRNAAGHDIGNNESQVLQNALEAFGIDNNEVKDGYGRALDRIYEVLEMSLKDLGRLLFEATVEVG